MNPLDTTDFESRPAPRRAFALLMSAAIFVGTLALYWPVHQFQSINYDDPIYIEAPSRVAEGFTAGSIQWALSSFYFNWHPLTWMSLMADYQFFGGSPSAMHLHSALLHAINGTLLFLLMLRWTNRPWLSAAVAAIFVVHPLRLEPVIWIAARKDVLNALFWFLALHTYTSYARANSIATRRIAFLSTHVLFILGLAAKGMIVTFPAALLLLDVWPLKRHMTLAPMARFQQLLREKIPLFVLSAAGILITVAGQHSADTISATSDVPVAWRVANALHAYVLYLANTIWPVGLAPVYPHPAVFGDPIPVVVTLGAFAILAIISFVAWTLRRSQPAVLIGWLWFILTLLPVIGLIQIGSQSRADRYTYIPSVGLIIAIACVLADVARRLRTPPWLQAGVAGACVVLLATVSFLQMQYWRNSETLFRHAIAVTSRNYIAENQLALALVDRGDTAAARTHFAAAVDFYPRYAIGHNNLAIALERSGDLAEAAHHYDRALQIDPNYVDAMINLGTLLSKVQRYREAVPYFARVAELRPGDAQAHNDFGQALAAAGRFEAAVEQFRAALRIDSTDANARKSLKLSMAMLDRYRSGGSAGKIAASQPASPTSAASQRAASQPAQP